MPLHDLIFSNERGKRLQRHLLFWTAWWLYLSFCEYLYQLPLPGQKVQPWYLNVGPHPLFKILLLSVLYAMACYAIIYVVLPMIEKRKWLSSIPLLLVIFGFLYSTVYFLFWTAFPYINRILESANSKIPGTKFWPAVSLGVIAPLKIVASAVAIKYVKSWWLKQKESERLDREKVNAELQLLKAQVQPDFLFKTLRNLHTHALASSPHTITMILKLSDLLSYMLYECDKPLVPLEKEIEMMKEYMLLEKIRHNDSLEMEVNVRGILQQTNIAPFLLLPFIENSVNHSTQMTEQAWVNMDIRIEDNNFSMSLTNGVAETFQKEGYNSNRLANVQKRLSILYPGRHELKITSEQEMLIVQLNIKLGNVSTGSIEGLESISSVIENKKTSELV